MKALKFNYSVCYVAECNEGTVLLNRSDKRIENWQNCNLTRGGVSQCILHIMNQIDTEIKRTPFKPNVLVYKFKYKFKNKPYLVADKYGNFFILHHCKNKRTVNFKKLNSSKGYIYYNRIKYYLSRLEGIKKKYCL